MSTNSDLILARWAEEDEDELTFDPIRGTRANWDDDLDWLAQAWYNSPPHESPLDDRNASDGGRGHRIAPDSV